jgi:glycosyltransferase involved in cell wall biosynthesis
MHTIDILIPTYNPKREHLTVALESLQKQTFQDWKAFIHDDCSPNGETESFVQPFLSDSRITFKRSPKRLGIGGNWNACFKQTSAPIVAYLFQDDLWSPLYLEKGIETLQKNPSAGFVSMEHEYKTEGGMTNLPLYEGVQAFRKANVAPGLHTGKKFLHFWILHELHPNVIREPSFVLMRRNVMEKAGPFLEDMPQFLDTEYWLRLLAITDWYNLTNSNYGTFRVHPSAASNVNQITGQGMFDRLRCFEGLISRLQGEERSVAIKARNHALITMVGKFLKRQKAGAETGMKKKNSKDRAWIIRFCLRHPLLIIKTIITYFLTKK